MTIYVTDDFEAAHFLPNVPAGHKCGDMHGHSYRIRIEVEGGVDPRLGWVIDYADVKEALNRVKAHLDHKTVNDVIENPTCENLAVWIADQLKPSIPGLSRVEIAETRRCGVIYEVEYDRG